MGTPALFPRLRLIACLAAVTLAGCSGDRAGDGDPDAPSRPVATPGVYSGVFPCAECPGIPTSLWLRPDGRFFVRQSYPPTGVGEAMDAYGLGRWSWDAAGQLIVLQGAGPKRVFTRPDPDTLAMQTDSDLEHRLTRDPASPEFSAAIRMAGTMDVRGDEAYFTECLTGFVTPVDQAGEFGRFLHQYRRAAPPGAPVSVELRGRFSWAEDGAPESMSIERFITVSSADSC